MKTLEQFVKEIETSKGLREKFKKLKDKDAVAVFLKKHDCGATAEELAEYIKANAGDAECELSDEEVSSVSGGVWFDLGFGRFWVDETIPDRNITIDPILPDSPITIEDDD